MTTRASGFMGDPFAELGVPSTASFEEVRRAFRRRARETHPDHQPDDPQAAKRFARLRAAYEEAVERIKGGYRGHARHDEPPRTRRTSERDEQPRRRFVTELELSARVAAMVDASLLRHVMARHGHRPMIALALARNPAFPTDALPALRRSTDYHWTVEAAIAARPDAYSGLLGEIAQLARETAVGLAIVRNGNATTDTLDTLVHGPIRFDAALEHALAAHPRLSVKAATRLAARHATHQDAIVRLIERGDLPEDLLQRLAGQSSRPYVASAARRDLLRRGVTPPPPRGPQRSSKTLTGYWR